MAPSFSKISAALVVASAAVPASAFWRMPCRGRVDYGRVDPLVDFGRTSKHAHVVHGSSGFSETATYDDLNNGHCTSCGVMEDKSAYWTPSVHFEHADGTTEMVEQVGGMLSYYLLYGDNVQAFPAGFKMIAGDYTRRKFPKGDPESQDVLSGKALGFNCLNYNTEPEGSLQRHHFPDKAYMDENCVDGIRLELMFPSCWNGQDTDMVDHKSHIKYPSEVMDGECPPGYDTRVVSLFYETIWNTYAFAGKPGRFTLSTGDTTGYGYHGDFMMGWNEGFLDEAVKTCTSDSGEIAACPLFTLQDDSKADQCKTSDVRMHINMVDDCMGPRKGLCGPNPIGTMEPAPPAVSSQAPTPILPGPSKGGSKPQNQPKPSHDSKPNHPSKPDPEKPSSTTDLGISGGTTPAPAHAPASPNDGLELLYTKTYTSNGAVYEEVVVETEVTAMTTATTTAGVNRRHLHHMHRRHS